MDEGLLLLVVGAVLCASALVALGAARTGVPVLVAFLALGMLLGSDGPGGIDFDEAVFGDPENFRIDRNPNPHMAFGFGSHFCLGNQLARLERSMMTKRVLERLPDLRLADGAEVPLRPANFVSGPDSMPVVFTPSAKVLG